MLKSFFRSTTKTVTFAAIVLGASFLVSRFLGLLRDRLLAGHFGAGAQLDIYFAAFRIPDFVYGIIVVGGISAVFVPIFSQYFLKDKEEGWKLASNVINIFLLALAAACGILAALTPWLINYIAPGFGPGEKQTAIELTRIMFLSPVIFGISSIFSGMLHYFDRFFVYAMAPILYNTGIIIGIVFFYPIFGLIGLVYGVILGALMHLSIQVPAAISSGFKYHSIFNLKSKGVRTIFKLMVPRVIGSAAYQINLIVVTAIASTLAAGSITIFNFANNLQYIPIGIIGASFALASFPTLSRAWINGSKDQFIDHFSDSFRQIIFMVVPISFIIFLLRAQIVRLILGTGQFSWADTRLTAAALGIFCIGIFAASLVPFLVRVFYSFHNTKTPVIISLVAMAVNVVLSFSLVYLIKSNGAVHGFFVSLLKLQGVGDVSVVGLPLALSLAVVLQFALLMFFLRKKMGKLRLTYAISSLRKVILASLFMAGTVYITLWFAAFFVSTDTFLGLLAQTAAAAVLGAAAFLAVAYFVKSPEMRNIWGSVTGQFRRR